MSTVAPNLVIPVGYPWTGHADELVAAATASGCSYSLVGQELTQAGETSDLWFWMVESTSATFTAVFGRSGYFQFARQLSGTKLSLYQESRRQASPLSRRAAFDRLLQAIRQAS